MTFILLALLLSGPAEPDMGGQDMADEVESQREFDEEYERTWRKDD